MYIYHSEHASILLNMYTGKIRKKYLNSKYFNCFSRETQRTSTLAPRQLSYPSGVSDLPETPKTATVSIASSLSTPGYNPNPTSFLQSSLTPSLQSLSIGREKGRPRKQLVAPALDGFPIGSTEDEKQKWFHKKCTEQWWYNILTSNKAAELRVKERARCKEHTMPGRRRRWRHLQQLEPPPPHAELPDDNVQEREKSTELSRLWYVKHTRKILKTTLNGCM